MTAAKPRPRAQTGWALLLSLMSAAMLVAAFPSFSQPALAWVGLVPLLILLRHSTPRVAFFWSWLAGTLYFLGSIWWLTHVTVVGWVILCVYLGLFFGLFGWVLTKSEIWRDGPGFGRRIVFAAGLWTMLEFARTHLLSGFGWNLLSYSQTPWPLAIQLAETTGAWGVSFVIVTVNALLAEAWLARKFRVRVLAYLGAAAVGSALIGYGLLRLPVPGEGRVVRATVVQGNIAQEEKWDDSFREPIMKKYDQLTREAKASQSELVVWPETSVPGFLELDEPLTQRVMSLSAEIGAPILVGAPHGQLQGLDWRTTNGAALVESSGVNSWYDKIHLVPFGEYIPLERLFPWLRDILPPIGDFLPGQEHTVFHLEPELRFSVLVCFEDLFPELARRFVQEGARMLIVITNDAWFGPTGAAYQHAQASTLRAVELRVPVIRAANTGWSGCIDQAGRWTGQVRDRSGKTLFVAGTHTCESALGETRTIYQRFGDWFILLCVLALALVPWRVYQAKRRLR
jgi:apolipoprotein N-acyltransferase